MKTAIITGGTGAIGAALVREFSKDHNVIFTYLNNTAAAKGLESEFENARGFRCDVSDRKSADRILSRCSDCELLINNAGIAKSKLFTEITELEWYKMLDVHLTGAFNYSQGVIPEMIRRKSGCIINISSIWGIVGASCEVHYSTVKAGLIGFTKALAKELGPSGIRVNAIAPGLIESPMNSEFSREELEQVANNTALMKIGAPTDIATAARYLANAQYVTGQVLGVDGGS
ncbi:MAG: SDR family oxidoreductase [Oscillospiraceae bacterium]|nr:SDR family oxidoreductase [Oscillospiraceae bacterium]